MLHCFKFRPGFHVKIQWASICNQSRSKYGRIVEHGPADQLYEAPREPYTRALMNAALDLGSALP